MAFEEKIIMGVLHHRGAQLNNIGEATGKIRAVGANIKVGVCREKPEGRPART